jgi:hypothetical protein
LSNDKAVWLIAGDFFEASVLILPVLEIKVRDETFSPGVSTRFPKNDYAIGISNSWRSENQRIDDTEDGSVRSDTERKSQHGDYSERRLPQKASDAVLKIL